MSFAKVKDVLRLEKIIIVLVSQLLVGRRLETRTSSSLKSWFLTVIPWERGTRFEMKKMMMIQSSDRMKKKKLTFL